MHNTHPQSTYYISHPQMNCLFLLARVWRHAQKNRINLDGMDNNTIYQYFSEASGSIGNNTESEQRTIMISAHTPSSWILWNRITSMKNWKDQNDNFDDKNFDKRGNCHNSMNGFHRIFKNKCCNAIFSDDPKSFEVFIKNENCIETAIRPL